MQLITVDYIVHHYSDALDPFKVISREQALNEELYIEILNSRTKRLINFVAEYNLEFQYRCDILTKQ